MTDAMAARTLGVAAVAAVAAGMLGVGCWLAQRRLARAERALWRVAAGAAFLMPGQVAATSLLAWLGGHDLIGPVLAGSASGSGAARLVASGLVLAAAGWPLVLWVLAAAWDRVDPALREAAELSLRAWPRWTRVILPLYGRALLLGLGLVFVWAAVELTVPMALGAPVLAVRIYTRFNTSYRVADALAGAGSLLWILGLVWLGLLLLAWRVGRPDVMGLRRDPVAMPGERAAARRWARAWLACSLLVTAGLPLLGLARHGGRVLAAYGLIVRAEPELLARSVAVAAGAATAALGLGLAWAAWRLRARCGDRARPAIEGWDLVLLLPWLVPGVLLGAVIVERLSAASWARLIYPSLGLMMALLGIRFAFAPAKLAWLVWSAIPRGWWEAGAVLGVGRGRMLARIALPLLGPGLLLGWVLAYWLALGETGLAVMTAPPGAELLEMRIFHLLHYGYEHEVAAGCLWLLTLAWAPPVLLAGAWLGGRRRAWTR